MKTQANKVLSLYLILRLLVVDAYNMYSSYYGHYCTAHSFLCVSYVKSFLSGYNDHDERDADFQIYTQILHFVLTLLSIPFFAYCRLRFVRVSEFLDTMDITDDDFSIMVQDIPPIIRDLNPTSMGQVPGPDEKQSMMKDLYDEEDLHRNL